MIKIYKILKTASFAILAICGVFGQVYGTILLHSDPLPDWVTPLTLTEVSGFCYIYNGLILAIVAFFIYYPRGKNENKN